MRLSVENRRLEDAEIVYEADYSSFRFISSRLSNHLDTLIIPVARKEAGDSVGYFDSRTLASAGYDVFVDMQSHELRISPPSDKKRMQRTNLAGGYVHAPRGVEVAPAAASFYVNYRVNDRLYYRRSLGGGAYDSDRVNRDPAVAYFDGAISALGWVLEGSAAVSEPGAWQGVGWENFSRGDFRLVRDIVSLSSRFYAGEIDIGTELLSGEAVGGVRFEHNPWFFGNNPHDGRNSVEFFLPRAGWVEIFMDGVYRERLRLPAGRHELSGFGGNVGRNRVKLVLRHDGGGEEEVPFEYILSDPRNMPKGESRYSLSAGFRREPAPSPQAWSYVAEETAVSADLFYGLSRRVSLGLAGQASPYSGVTGTQVLVGLGDIGYFDMRAFMSYVGFETLGGRAEFNFTSGLVKAVSLMNRLLTRSVDKTILPRMSLSARGYYASQMYNAGLFVDPSTVAASGYEQVGVSGNLGFGFFRGSLTATGGADFRDSSRAGYVLAGYSYGGRVSQSVGRGSISASAGVNVRGETRTPYFSLASNLGIGGGVRVNRHQFSMSTSASTAASQVVNDNDTVPDAYDYDWRFGANAGWRWSNGYSGAGYRSYSANLSVSDLLEEEGYIPSFSAGLSHDYNRARLLANYNLSDVLMPSVGFQTQVLNAAFSGSLMFADGAWALGRPVQGTGGFILAGTERSLKGAKVHIDRSRQTGLDHSRTGWLGAAYKNNLTEYRSAQLTVTLTDAPPNAFLQNNQYYANARYKQGYSLRLGEKQNTVILEATIIQSGRPVTPRY
jgi:hypothetical protein